MTTITLSDNVNKEFLAKIQSLLETLESCEYTIEKDIPALDEAICEYERGEVTHCADFDDYLKKINA